MSQLSKYLDRVNFWRVQVEKKAPYTVATLTEDDAQRIMDQLEGDLSPENLSCDGELSRTETNARFRLFTGAMRELGTRFPNVRPKWEDYGVFSTPAQPTVDKGAFRVGAVVHVNHPQLGGRASGRLIKVNRKRCVIEFPVKGQLSVPMELIETA